MRDKLLKSMKYGESVDMMYMAVSGKVTKRRVDVLRVSDGAFQAYCYLRKAKRTFKVDNVLALIPVHTKESLVI